MSRHDDLNLDDLFREARTEHSPQRWRDQRDIFRRLRLGGASELFATRVAHAAASLPRGVVLGVMVVSAVTVGTMYSTAHSERTGSAVENAGPSAVVEPPRTEVPAAPSESVVPSMNVDALPSATAPAPLTRSVPIAAASPQDDLARELASVSNIRAQIANREYAKARRAVRVHRATFTHGALAQEVSVLEIEALRGLGDDRERCRVGRAFLDAHATSAYRERVLTLTSDCNEKPSSGASHDEPHSSP
ncbi:hypothetical protein AKJ09_04494 [Labilithrix luteola]|uniref:Uncharacterized protein n=1 Tax=Labilithrix luteola TaxID=1391654 RepID=A0A0K1PWD0_9BACT|nr:hypothetical protein [Labilithrix luteola]AKU97830.1 hypothetical protein AKJ09_04494 [Labilithrix luteola]